MPKAPCHEAWALDPSLLSDSRDSSPLTSADNTSPTQTVVITYIAPTDPPATETANQAKTASQILNKDVECTAERVFLFLTVFDLYFRAVIKDRDYR